MEKFPYKKVKESGEIPAQYRELLQNLFERFMAFEKKHEPRFHEVKNDNRGAIQSRGEFMPSDFEDFMEYCDIEDIDLSHDRITDAHFYGYHQWRIKDRYQSPQSEKEKEYTHMGGAIALALAMEDNKVEHDLFTYNQKDFISYAYNTFEAEMKKAGVKNPETNESTYRAKLDLIKSHVGYNKYLDWAKAKLPHHFQIGVKLFEEHFSD